MRQLEQVEFDFTQPEFGFVEDSTLTAPRARFPLPPLRLLPPVCNSEQNRMEDDLFKFTA